MKTRTRLFPSLAATLATVMLTAASLTAAPAVQTETTNSVKSVFVMPASTKEGRDPFFPDSTRPYETTVAHTADLTTLELKGVSRIGDHYYAIIGTHTFGVGDEEDVVTSQGRIHVRCVEINANSVVIESGGQQHTLTFSGSP
jgi:hypothetical protein